ncbi:MAG TPA: hypothetical protein VIK01_18015 [Polyangiaceae bacterium]
MLFYRHLLPFTLSICALTACGSSDNTASTSAGDAQTPPTTNGNDVEAWLKAGSYKSWSCETVSHPQLKVSPHGQNRICSNDLIASFTGTGERPKGSAAVKELLDDSDAIVGYAVSVKLAAASDSGNGWYWYERIPKDSMAAPHDTGGVVADGPGTAQTAGTKLCVGCHSAAGSDDTHTVTKSSDYVYDVIN